MPVFAPNVTPRWARTLAMPDLLTRLLALAPHLHPSIARAAEWDRLLRDIKAERGRTREAAEP